MRCYILRPILLLLLAAMLVLPPFLSYSHTSSMVDAEPIPPPNGVNLNATTPLIAYDEYLPSTGTGNSSLLSILVGLVNASDIGECKTGELSEHKFQVYNATDDSFVFEDNLQWISGRGWVADNYSLLQVDLKTGLDYYVKCFFERDIAGVGITNVTTAPSLEFNYRHRLTIATPDFTYIGDTSDYIDIFVEHISSTLRGALSVITNTTILFRNSNNYSETHEFYGELSYNVSSDGWEVIGLNISLVLSPDEIYQIRVGAEYNVTEPYHSGISPWSTGFTFKGPYLRIAVPEVIYVGREIQELNIKVESVWDSIYWFLVNDNVTIANFSIYLASGQAKPLINGTFLWNNTGNYWYLWNFNISDYIDTGILTIGEYYNISAFFETGILGQRWPINASSSFSSPFILDRDPPNLENKMIDPDPPTDEDFVVVTGEVSDDAKIGMVLLSYFNGTDWINVTMQGSGGILANFTALIPRFPERFVMQYRFYINDTQDAWFTSTIYTYTVADTPPLIAYVSHSPQNPTDMKFVTVNATVTDGTGVETVVLLYSFNGVTFLAVEMTQLVGNVYQAVIPPYPALSEYQFQPVLFKINATDVYGNSRISTTFAYLVQGTLPGLDPIVGLLAISIIGLVVVILIVVYKVYERF